MDPLNILPASPSYYFFLIPALSVAFLTQLKTTMTILPREELAYFLSPGGRYIGGDPIHGYRATLFSQAWYDTRQWVSDFHLVMSLFPEGVAHMAVMNEIRLIARKKSRIARKKGVAKEMVDFLQDIPGGPLQDSAATMAQVLASEDTADAALTALVVADNTRHGTSEEEDARRGIRWVDFTILTVRDPRGKVYQRSFFKY